MLTNLLNLYRTSLIVVVPFTTIIGFSSGLSEVFTVKTNGQKKITTMIAYTTMGAMIGTFYPITFPYLTCETFK
jgi:hypothetical protein